MPEPTTTPTGSTGDPSQNTPQYVTQEAFNGTAAMISRMNKTLEGLTGGMLTFDKLAEVGLVEKQADGTFKPKTVTAAPAAKPAAGDPPEWKAETDRLNAEIKKRDDALAAERRKAADTEQRGAIIDALNQSGAVNASRDVVHVQGIVKNASGQYVQMTKDQYGADVEVPLDQAVATFLTANPELRRAQGRPGSGTPTGGGTGNFTGTTASREMLSDPVWYAKNREAIMNGTIQIA